MFRDWRWQNSRSLANITDMLCDAGSRKLKSGWQRPEDTSKEARNPTPDTVPLRIHRTSTPSMANLGHTGESPDLVLRACKCPRFLQSSPQALSWHLKEFDTFLKPRKLHKLSCRERCPQSLSGLFPTGYFLAAQSERPEESITTLGDYRHGSFARLHRMQPSLRDRACCGAI